MKRYPFQPVESRDQSQSQNRYRHWLSTFLFLLAFGTGVTAVAIYYVQSRATEQPDLVQPTSVPGEYDLGGVVAALRDRDLTVEYGRRQARSSALSPPAQTLTVDDAALYIFIYPDAATRATEATGLTAADIRLATATGTPVPVTVPVLVMGSNIVALLDSDSTEVRDKVTQTITELR